MYDGLNQDVFTVNHEPEPIKHVENLEEYNEQEGLALSPEEIEYLHNVEKQVGRPLTDSEIFGFAQINSEHCRHKIFGGTFIIDGQEMESSLFQMIKKTTKENPNKILSAYKDNVAFAQGPVLKHGVVVSVFRTYGEIFLYTRNAVETHVLCNLYGICAPRSDHLTARSHEESVDAFALDKLCFTIQPAQFINFILIELMVNCCCYHALLRSPEEKNHISL